MQAFPNSDVECIHDFEFHHSRRPKVLVQTAGHVAGAVYYYQRIDVLNDPWPSSRVLAEIVFYYDVYVVVQTSCQVIVF